MRNASAELSHRRNLISAPRSANDGASEAPRSSNGRRIGRRLYRSRSRYRLQSPELNDDDLLRINKFADELEYSMKSLPSRSSF